LFLKQFSIKFQKLGLFDKIFTAHKMQKNIKKPYKFNENIGFRSGTIYYVGALLANQWHLVKRKMDYTTIFESSEAMKRNVVERPL